MKKRILNVMCALLPLIATLFLTSCLNGDGENSQTFVGEPLVVSKSYSSTTTLENRYGIPFFAPQLNEYSLLEGTCLIANFKINYDEQTSADGYTLSELSGWQTVDHAEYLPAGDTISADYDARLKNIQVYTQGSSVILIKNFLFLVATHAMDAKAASAYAVGFGEGDEIYQDGAPTLYISAQEESSSSAQSVAVPFAINLSEFIAAADKYKKNNELVFNIKYRTGTDEEGNAVFAKTAPSSFTISFPQEEM